MLISKAILSGCLGSAHLVRTFFNCRSGAISLRVCFGYQLIYLCATVAAPTGDALGERFRRFCGARRFEEHNLTAGGTSRRAVYPVAQPVVGQRGGGISLSGCHLFA